MQHWHRYLCFAATLLVAVTLVMTSGYADDWPMWRHDPERSAVTSEELPAKLHFRWKLSLPKLEPAWPDQDRLRFDVAYQPIVKGKTMFVASPRADSVTAYDTDKAREKWRFYANGPVRFAPLAWKDKLYFVSDDGYLYCLTSADGKLVWKFRGGPTDRMVLGNKRLISMWPARGAPVISDGKIYFGAGIWPMMGIFLYALDAETGDVVWQNDATGPMWINQPHNSPAFAGLAPQGHFALAGERLLVPNGRAVPASIDLKTGKVEYFRLAKSGKVGGYAVTTSGKFFACGGRVFDVKTGLVGERIHPWRYRVFAERYPGVLDGDMYYTGLKHRFEDESELVMVFAHRLALKELVDRRKRRWIGPGVAKLWGMDTGDRVHLKAGSRLFTSGDSVIFATHLPPVADERIKSWSSSIHSVPESMIAADGKLFVSTRDGSIYCYAGEDKWFLTRYPPPRPTRDEEARRRARDILAASGVTEGYCLALGLKDGKLIQELAIQSKLHVIGIDADAEKVARIRRRLDPLVRGHEIPPKRGTDDYGLRLYGHRLTVICADPAKVKLPPYFASLIVTEDVEAGGDTGGYAAGLAFVRQVAQTLRPYGGVACFPEHRVGEKHFRGLLAIARFDRVKVDVDAKSGLLLARRTGPLPGAADWTHQYGDAANTTVSKDKRVKLPLGLLWFGGPTHEKVLPRHGHGPVEHVFGGRLFIEGPDSIRATDVYTGRLLWERELPGIGKAYDNVYHQPGANAIGSNFASARDGIYLIQGDNCLRLDPATGKTTSRFTVPPVGGTGEKSVFGFVAVSGDLLITGVTPIVMDWDPLFRKGQFWRLTSERRLGEMVEIIEGWTGGPLVTREDARGKLAFVMKNFNAILDEPSLEDRVPRNIFRRGTRSFDALVIREEITSHLASREPTKYDTTLRALNRKLLQIVYPKVPKVQRGEVGYFNWDHTSSREIVVMNRHDGKVLWRKRARLAFRHNTIVTAGGKVFAIDAIPAPVLETLKRRGEEPKGTPRLLALDTNTGKPAWVADNDVFGTWLAYSVEHDVLVESGRGSRDMLYGEPEKKMRAYRGRDGTPLWQRENRHYGPLMLHGRRIISATDGYDLLTGGEVTWKNPFTGVEEEWRYGRMYGCNSPAASEHLLTFRSAAAGFYDLTNHGGTGNFGGFKSGCSANLIAADGVLNAPDYTRTCICSYQNQTSLALVHSPEVEMWTFNPHVRVGCDRITRIGLNFGAPGDRRTDEGTLWMEYPVVGGPSPKVELDVKPDEVEWFYRHSLRLTGDDGLRWVAASGGKGIREITVTLARQIQLGGFRFTKTPPRRYTVRLHFSEPDDAKPGDRIFDVTIQGKTVLENFDVVAAADGRSRAVVREFRGVTVASKLTVTLAPTAVSKFPTTLISGVEIVAEGW